MLMKFPMDDISFMFIPHTHAYTAPVTDAYGGCIKYDTKNPHPLTFSTPTTTTTKTISKWDEMNGKYTHTHAVNVESKRKKIYIFLWIESFHLESFIVLDQMMRTQNNKENISRTQTKTQENIFLLLLLLL